MKDNFFKAGRFAFLLPYIIMPIIIMSVYGDGFDVGFVFAYFIPMGIESPAIIIYPICWILSIVSFIICAVNSKKYDNSKDKKTNIIIAVMAGIWTIVHIILIIIFMNDFTIKF